MKQPEVAVNLFRRLICRVLGHKKHNGSIGTIGIRYCNRCLRITDQKTVRRSVTKGDIERRMKAATPAGGTFQYINWKKRIAHYSDPNGRKVCLLLP